MSFRTHTCGELTLADVGKEVKVCGFVETIRDLGGLVFLDIRDMYGITQVVTSGKEDIVDFSSRIPIESSVCVEGTVKKRDPETYNPKIATGEVEVVIKNITVLGKRTKMLPFEVNKEQDVRKDLRLKYRFLDLRSTKLQKNLILRAQVIQFIRSQMIEQGFLEVQTPILTSSSPEGARDYLVPSRLHPGKFYALPQAPQQFKQLLMVSGIDKYFQIAPCFRDEDARADRAPGEFYQLDMEMSYSTQEDVFSVIEPVVYNTFTKFSDKKVAEYPFPRIPYKEAMLKYGSDKPDLSKGDTIFFIADTKKRATELAGQIRQELGKRLELIDEKLFKFCWITDFPMYELDEHDKIDFCHNPFSMPQGGLEALESQEPLDILAYQYDIVCNGIELSSGAVRNHDPEIMIKAFEIAGYTKEDIETKFSALFNAFQFGAPPHAGIAPGIDRMLMLLTESETIRDVIAFPMNSKAEDLLMGAPGTVTREQLKDVHIKLDI